MDAPIRAACPQADQEPRVSRLFRTDGPESLAYKDFNKLFRVNVEGYQSPHPFNLLMDKLNRCSVGFKEALVVWIFLQAVYPRETFYPVQSQPLPRIFSTYGMLFTPMHLADYQLVNAFATQFLHESFNEEILTKFLSEVVDTTHFSAKHYVFLYSKASMTALLDRMEIHPKHCEQPGVVQGRFRRLRLISETPLDCLERFKAIYNEENIYLKVLKDLPLTYAECLHLLEDFYNKPIQETTPTSVKAQFIILARARKEGTPDPRYLEKLVDLLATKEPLFVLEWLADENLTTHPKTQDALAACPPNQLDNIFRIYAFKDNPLLFERFIALEAEFFQLPDWRTILKKTVIPLAMRVRNGYLLPPERMTFHLWLTRAGRYTYLQDLIHFAHFPVFWRTMRDTLGDDVYNKKDLGVFLSKVATVWPELVLEEHQKPAYPQESLRLKNTLDHALYYHHFPERMNVPLVPLKCITEAADLDVAQENLTILNLVLPHIIPTIQEYLEKFIDWVAVLEDEDGNELTDRVRIDTCLQALRILTRCLDNQTTTTEWFCGDFKDLIFSTVASLQRSFDHHSCYRFLLQLGELSEKNSALIHSLSCDLQPIVDLAWEKVETFDCMGTLRSNLEQLLQAKPKWFTLRIHLRPLPLCPTTIHKRNTDGNPRLVSVKRVRAHQPFPADGATQVGQKRKREEDIPLEITPWPAAAKLFASPIPARKWPQEYIPKPSKN